ncbi:MAG: aldehyde dehydrogenase family protein [Polyangiaceae bacterium]
MTLSSHVETPRTTTTKRLATDEDIVKTVERLRETFDSGATRPLDWRERELRQLERLITDNEAEILEALHSDLGKCRFEGVVSETGYTLGEIRHTLKQLRNWAKPRRAKVPLAIQPAKASIISEPLGLVLVIAPWNYPFQLAVGPLIAAIAAGNTAIVKPSEVAAATSALLSKLLPRYLDSSAFAVIEGGVSETTKLLEQRFDHILYTGNGAVGRIVMAAAAKHLTPVTLELGGKSPCIVDADVDLDVAAKRIVWGKFFNAGQTCIAADYLLLHESVAEQMLDRIRETVRSFYGADPRASSDFARIVNERHFDRLEKLLHSGTVVTGGVTDRESRYIAPTVLRDVAPDAPVMADEIFGPILPTLTVASIDEAIRFVNARPKPLALYVFTRNQATADQVLHRTSSGGMCVNDCLSHFAPPDLPFGGVGESGIGAYHGRFGFDTFSHQRAVLDKSTRVDPSLRYPPYGEDKLKWVKRLT